MSSSRNFILFPLLFSIINIMAQNTDLVNAKRVTEAAMGYIESIYEMDTLKVYKYVDKELSKEGMYYSKEDNKWSRSPMTFDRLVEVAANFNKEGRIPADAPKEVEILDLETKMANVKIKADWGMDYLLLIKDKDDQWKITKIVWQSYFED